MLLEAEAAGPASGPAVGGHGAGEPACPKPGPVGARWPGGRLSWAAVLLLVLTLTAAAAAQRRAPAARRIHPAPAPPLPVAKGTRRLASAAPAPVAAPAAGRGFEGFPAYKHGEWIYRRFSAAEGDRMVNRSCCMRHPLAPYGGNHSLKCRFFGTWSYGTASHPHPGMLAGDGYNCCRGTAHRQSAEGPAEWIWKPFEQESLSRPAWDAKHFCHLLGGRDVYLIGDSTFGQQWGVVVNMILESGGTCQDRIHHRSSDFLAPGPGERGKSLQSWLEPLLSNASARAVIVTGTGAHYNNFGQFNRTVKWLAAFFAEHRALFAREGRLRLIWRTNNAPHAECKKAQFSKPVKYEPGFMLNAAPTKYGFWKAVALYDGMSVDRLGRTALASTILDVTPLYLRPDTHNPPDCLHYCFDANTGTPMSLMTYKLYEALMHPDKVCI